jgi:putative DNA methylase
VPLSPNWWLRKQTKSVGGRSGQVGQAIRPLFSEEATAAVFNIVEVVNKKPFDPSVGTIRGGTGISPWAQNQIIHGDYIKSEAKAGRMGQQLCAVGLATQKGRRFRNVLPEDLAGVKDATKQLSKVRADWEAKGTLPYEHMFI